MVELLPIAGGCNCRAVRYTIDTAPLAVMACHCTSCRRQSGATYSVNLVVPVGSMTVTGELASWTDPDTESGQTLERQFCPICGSPIRSVPASAPGIYAVKAGTLDKPDSFAPEAHVWTESRLAWVALPDGVPGFPRNPRG
jgi:hypothetical protein